MEKDAFLLIGALIVAFFTLNWSDMKLIVAQIKEKIAFIKALSKEDDPQENTEQ